jgi:PAS domain S-box-containing protein
MSNGMTDNSLLIVFILIWVAIFGLHYGWLRKAKFPRLPWILWLMAAVILSGGAYAARQAGLRELGHVKQLTEDFARLYGSEMEEGGHWKLANDVAANDPLYLSLIEKEKTWETLNPDVADIYTLRKRPDGTNIFIVDSETDYDHNGKYEGDREQRTAVGEVYDKFDQGLEDALGGQANFDLVPITDRWGTWISAYVPLRTPSGKLDGVLGVDFDANKFTANIVNAQLRVLWMVAAALLILLGSSILNTILRAQIAERKKTEESLRLLGTAVEQSNESILITGAELDLPGPKIIFVNPAFTKMTGYATDEVIGKTPRILQGPKTDKTVLQHLRERLTRGEAFHGETINYRKDKSEFYIEWQIAPIRNSKGVITHFVSIQRDITERKRLEQQLIQSQKLETVGRLAGGVAHEFNNIVTAIIGHADMMLIDIPEDAPLATNAKVIRQAAQRCAGLTRQLLAYGRRQFLRPQNVNLNEVIASMDVIIRHLLGREINVCIVPAKDLFTVFADVGQMEEVITNVILNAKDAMPKGGKLTLETGNITFDEESANRYPELKPGHYATLAITDTGVGMSPEIKARIFEPFFTTKDIGKGTGLGLATAYGIIKQSGGHIIVYSELGKGTTFRIYLPELRKDLRQPRHTKHSERPVAGSEIILVVEDDRTLLDMASKFLRQLGYNVLTANDGEEALKVLEMPGGQPVNLLFTDIVMPKIDGIKLAERVRELYPGTKILFTSAYAENALIHQGIVAPGMTLLEKPFTLSTLAQKTRQALDSK